MRKRCITPDHVRRLLRQAIAAQGTQAAFAEHHQLDPSYLSRMLSGRLPLNTAMQRVLGVKRVVRYEVVEENGDA